jgi:hypothetical protein
MADFPRSLIEFQRRFADEKACAVYLADARWPDGFPVPGVAMTRAGNFRPKPSPSSA